MTSSRNPLLNPRHEHFAQLVAKGLSQQRAYVEAGFTAATPNVAAANASRLIRSHKVAARVRELCAEVGAQIAEEAGVSRDTVLQECVDIVEADARDLVGLRHTACRYCWGQGHAYHWRTRDEFEDAHAAWQQAQRTLGGPRLPSFVREPSDRGGIGYSRKREPNPECPSCDGEGDVQVYVTVDDKHPLYAGVRQTRYGVEVILKDQLKALDMLGRITGAYRPVQDQGTSGVQDMLRDFVETIRSRTSKSPIKHQEAENKE
ncbi:hypothetical protein FHG66_19910 [Rubellimicrobium rubrum]|uniref:Terminase small subunit n=1 Tax=Rubellimicrobium rubrum TaxID=2585369 RepID=A0A5C4MNH0_9RHOB|nr:terminase small subunit [Rubellimicrobium rubrum]TNC45941.1 hypothetical protein FHG66_19910 [Rubellimicrobium rubrum]